MFVRGDQRAFELLKSDCSSRLQGLFSGSIYVITDFVEYIITQHNFQNGNDVTDDEDTDPETDIYSDAALAEIKKYTLFELKSVFRKLIEKYDLLRKEHGTLTQYLGSAAAPKALPSA